MPWREVCSMDEKMRLMLALSAEEESVTELCEDFGISRKTAYKWWARYVKYGPAGLGERSHAPLVVPWAITQSQGEAIIGLRRAHPSWGPKKLRAKLAQSAPNQKLAGAEHDWRVATPPTTQSAAQAQAQCATVAAAAAHRAWAQRYLVHRFQRPVPYPRRCALRSADRDRRLQPLSVVR